MIYIIEEHNEAFYVYSKYIKKRNTTLIHIDEHHDLGSPIINETYIDNENNLKYQKNIAYGQLRTSDYIIPLCYQNLVKDIFWISNKDKLIAFDYAVEKIKSVPPYVILNIKKNKILNIFDQIHKRMYFLNLSKGMKQFMHSDYIVISLDLDFFSCDNRSGEYFEIETTESEYIKFISNLYHPIKLGFGTKMTIKKSGEDKYTLSYQAHDGPDENKENNLQCIENKIQQLKSYLISNCIFPQNIIICKSQISGYTPRTQADKILNRVITMFSEIYPKQELYFFKGDKE